ncbi:ABC transporter substrate-binding protein [soil metagenome]
MRDRGSGGEGQRGCRTRGILVLLLLLLAACSTQEGSAERLGETADSAVSAVDDAGRTVQLPRPALRIVSLVPAATETLVALGAGERVVARTDYDEAPEVAHIPSVGGGLDPSLEALVALQPELVITWREAANPRLRPRLEELGIPVFAVSTEDTSAIFSNIERFGHLTGLDGAADSLARSIRAELEAVRASVAGLPTRSVLYVVGMEPPMIAGPGTFIVQLIGVAGGRTVFPDLRSHWPQLSLEELLRRDPEIVLLSVGEWSHDAPRRMRTAPGWQEMPAVREGRVIEVPAALVNRPGPRIGESARLLRDALHPTLHAQRP